MNLDFFQIREQINQVCDAIEKVEEKKSEKKGDDKKENE